jgi:Ner family transcriptional regulator
MPQAGWHRADVVAAIHKRGTSLAELARDNGLADATLRAALTYPRKPSNQIIANFLGRKLHELWPHWFDEHGALIVSGRNATGTGRRPSTQKRARKLSLTGGRA